MQERGASQSSCFCKFDITPYILDYCFEQLADARDKVLAGVIYKVT